MGMKSTCLKAMIHLILEQGLIFVAYKTMFFKALYTTGYVVILNNRDRVLKNHGPTQHSLNINFIKYLT